MTSQPLRDERGLESLACAVDGSRTAGWAAAQHHDIVVLRWLRRLVGRSFAPENAFQRLQQFSKVGPAYVHDGVAVHHRGHALDAEGLNVGLGQLAIDHVMLKIRVHERHLVQRLDHVWAIRAAQRNVGAQAHGTLERLHAALDALVGQFAFSVAVEQGNDERGKFVPAGNAAEADAGRAAVAKNIEAHARDFVGDLGERDLVAARSNLGEQLTQLLLLGVGAAK